MYDFLLVVTVILSLSLGFLNTIRSEIGFEDEETFEDINKNFLFKNIF